MSDNGLIWQSQDVLECLGALPVRYEIEPYIGTDFRYVVTVGGLTLTLTIWPDAHQVDITLSREETPVIRLISFSLDVAGIQRVVDKRGDFLILDGCTAGPYSEPWDASWLDTQCTGSFAVQVGVWPDIRLEFVK